MEDLTSSLPSDPVTALAPTSQEAGNMTASNELALTAPGSQPVDPKLPDVEQADPHIISASYDPKGRVHVVNDAGGKQIPDSNTARPTRYTQDDGTGWKRS